MLPLSNVLEEWKSSIRKEISHLLPSELRLTINLKGCLLCLTTVHSVHSVSDYIQECFQIGEL